MRMGGNENSTFLRTWFTFAYMSSSVRLSSVCLSSVTFVRPTQAIEIFGNISRAIVRSSTVLLL